MQAACKTLQRDLLAETNLTSETVTTAVLDRLLNSLQVHAHPLTSAMLDRASTYAQPEGVSLEAYGWELAEMQEGLGLHGATQPEQVQLYIAGLAKGR